MQLISGVENDGRKEEIEEDLVVETDEGWDAGLGADSKD